MPWYVTAVAAAFCVIVVEVLNRQGLPLLSTLPRTVPFIVLAQVCLYWTWRNAPLFLSAWVAFSLSTIILRLLANHFIVQEPLDIRAFVGVFLVVTGAYLVAFR